LGGGKGREGGAGETGETPGFGGVAPGVPRDACRLPRAAGTVRHASAARSAAAGFRVGRCGAGMGVCRAERGSPVSLPRSWVRPVPGFTPLSSVMGAAGSVVAFGGGRSGGLGENMEPGRVFRGRGGSGCSPSAFLDWSFLLSVYSCSRAVVFLTLPSLLCEGVRSGTRRRRGASASAQAGGGIGPETRRTVPARAGTVLVRPLCGR
jgi:hypothetical protein